MLNLYLFVLDLRHATVSQNHKKPSTRFKVLFYQNWSSVFVLSVLFRVVCLVWTKVRRLIVHDGEFHLFFSHLTLDL